MAKILNGKEIAAIGKGAIAMNREIYELETKEDITLIIFQAGDNPASNVYIRNKQKACEEVGIKSIVIKADSPKDLTVKILSNIVLCDAMMLQLPLPKEFGDPQQYINLIPPEKDADCLTTENLGELFLGTNEIAPCTADGVMMLLKMNDIEIAGKHAVIVGRSNIVGKPLAHMLLEEDATVTVCHSKTKNLAEFTRSADILIAAIGKPKFITADMVKNSAIVVDVGINRTEDGKICGDVDFDTVQNKSSWITPVPGGVGPMTVTMLLQNTLTLACMKNKEE